MGCQFGGDNSRNPDSYIEVNSKAEKVVDPDTFHLGINLSESAKGNIALREAKMMAAFATIGIDVKSDLTMTGVSGDSDWYWWRRSKNVIQNKSYILKAKSTDVLSRDKIGYVNYYLQKVEFSGVDSLKQEVQQAAVRQARIKADAILAGDNKKAGDLIYIQEQMEPDYGSIYDRNIALESNETSMKSDRMPSPSFEKIKIYYKVVARYAIK